MGGLNYTSTVGLCPMGALLAANVRWCDESSEQTLLTVWAQIPRREGNGARAHLLDPQVIGCRLEARSILLATSADVARGLMSEGQGAETSRSLGGP